MKYAIYLDDTEIEVFNTGETFAIQKYDETKEMYLNEEIYDKIELVKMEVVKTDTL